MKRSKQNDQFFPLLLLNSALIIIVLIAFFFLGKYETITVNSIALNIRTGPGMNYDVQTQVKKGENLIILSEKNQWYNVRLDNKETGWVASWLVTKNTSAQTNVTATVTTDKTKLRATGDTSGEVLKSLAKGTKVTITLETNGWSQVQVGKKDGWIHSDLLSVDSDSKHSDKTTSTPTSNLVYAREDSTKVRSEANVSSKVVTTLSSGQSITYVSTSGDWYKVKTSDNKEGYVANWVVDFQNPKNKSASISAALAEATIVLDPGHGGSDPGSESTGGSVYEKVVTLETAAAVKTALEKTGANVIMTRDSDKLVSLADIAVKSNKAKADAFVSFHYDSSPEANEASGVTTYYYSKSNMKLANTVNTSLKASLPLANRGVEYGDYQVLRDNHQPAILLELGYMNNDSDLATFNTAGYRSQVAEAVTEGLANYFSK